MGLSVTRKVTRVLGAQQAFYNLPEGSGKLDGIETLAFR